LFYIIHPPDKYRFKKILIAMIIIIITIVVIQKVLMFNFIGCVIYLYVNILVDCQIVGKCGECDLVVTLTHTNSQQVL